MRTYLRFVVALFIYSTCLHKAEGHQLQVGTNLAYKSIHNAISAAKTGDSVIVHAGVYHEKYYNQ